MASPPISAVIIAANAGSVIAPCLESLAFLPDVVVYLNNSTDDTRSICAGFPNVRVIDGEFSGFGPTKNNAAACAHHDWVFSIDTDESIDPTLANSLRSIDLRDPNVAYELIRCNRFHGRHVAVGGWGNDRLVRLYNRTTARFNAKAVHEKIVLDNGVSRQSLSGRLWHEAVLEIDQFLVKISRYSTLAAESKPGGPLCHPAFALLRAQFAFFKSYILQRGCIAGYRGLVIAYASAVGTFFRYTKRYERYRRQRDSARPS
ncbi:MAG: glycosyltransferase family 2 protein [Pseudomonadota bacterium]